MSDQVEEEELRAIMDSMVPSGGEPRGAVEPRNFRQPRRLSAARLRGLACTVGAALHETRALIVGPLRGTHKLRLASITEVNALGALEDLEPPFLVYCFDCASQPTWLVWTASAAAATCEQIVSGAVPEREQEKEARPLSRAERRVIEDLLARVVRPMAAALSFEAGAGRVAQEPEELIGLDTESDPRRLLAHLAFDGPGGPSDMLVYLAAVDERERADAQHAAEPSLPRHLESVPFELSACLASIEIPLAELLGVEVGDVIPLGVPRGSTVEVRVEDQVHARATWGRRDGRLTIQITEVLGRPSDPAPECE